MFVVTLAKPSFCPVNVFSNFGWPGSSLDTPDAVYVLLKYAPTPSRLDPHRGAADRIRESVTLIPGTATKETGGSDPHYSHLRTVKARSDRPYVTFVQST